MANLSRNDVLKLARLARITLSEEEITEFEAEFNEILQYVEQLQAVDVAAHEQTTQVTGLENVTRSDEIKAYPYTVDELIKNVPQTQDGQIKVKRMVG